MDLVLETLPSPAAFTDSLHALYRNVFRRSAYPLECLTPSFFRAFPAAITVFRAHGQTAGFIQTLHRGDTLIFMFGGIDYTLRPHHDTYLNMLLHIIRTGIETGARFIDLGQTAEEAKVKLGARLVPRFMHATHSSPSLQWILRQTANLLTHRKPEVPHHVFRS
jgi:hypothetical protein